MKICKNYGECKLGKIITIDDFRLQQIKLAADGELFPTLFNTQSQTAKKNNLL